MIPDKLTKQILADSIPEWNNPGFTDSLMQQIMAVEARKTRRRHLLILAAVVIAAALAVYALVNLLKMKSSALATPVNGLEHIGAWISGKEYILLPLVLLLLTKRLIDSRRPVQNAGS